MKIFSKTLWAAALTAASFTTKAQTVEVVQPDSHYFANWVFLESTNSPISVETYVDIAPGNSNNNASLAGNTLTITNDSTSATAGTIFQLWQLATPSAPGIAYGNPAYLPENIDLTAPANASMLTIDKGQASLMFTDPLPKGAVFFLRDVDSDETIDIHFVDCSGNPVDAGNFTFLQISDPALMPLPPTTPPNFSIEGTAPTQYWHVWPITSVTGNDPESINGIVINSNQVCGVQLNATRSANGGGVTYGFGLPAAPYLNVTKSVASVNGSTTATRVTQPQDTVDYAITIKNTQNFDIPVQAGTIQDSLPAGLTFSSSADFTCPASLPCSNLNDVTVPANSSITLHMTATVDSGLSRTATPTLTNTVAITNLNCAAAGNQCSVSTRTSPDAASVSAVPTLGEMAMALLAMLLAGGAAARMRRRH